MNAKQMADELENIYWIQGDGKGKPFQQYADFVRQQQAEIEALKLQLHTTLTNRDLRTYDGKLDINNEPVAWINRYGDEGWLNCCLLYTSPSPRDRTRSRMPSSA